VALIYLFFTGKIKRANCESLSSGCDSSSDPQACDPLARAGFGELRPDSLRWTLQRAQEQHSTQPTRRHRRVARLAAGAATGALCGLETLERVRPPRDVRPRRGIPGLSCERRDEQASSDVVLEYLMCPSAQAPKRAWCACPSGCHALQCAVRHALPTAPSSCPLPCGAPSPSRPPCT